MIPRVNKIGAIIALIGGAISLLAYFALPVFNFGIISATAPQLLSLTASISTMIKVSNDYSWIWMAAAVSGGICLASLIPLISRGEIIPPVAPGYPPRMRNTEVALVSCVFIIGFALVGIGFIVVPFIDFMINNSSSINYLGSGFWIYGLGCGASLIGGIAQALA